MAYSAPPASREFLWDIFSRVDADRSGYISANELQVALSNGTWSPFNQETVRLMIGMFDKENRGTVSFDDFGALWQYVTDWQNCFRGFDRDGSGSIDRGELQSALITFNYNLSNECIDTILRKFDRRGDGKIFFDDFIQCCVVLQTLTAAFQQLDSARSGYVTIHYEQFLNMVLSLKI